MSKARFTRGLRLASSLAEHGGEQVPGAPHRRRSEGLRETMETLHPASFARWRDTRLGALTEHLELDLVLELAGPLAGMRVLDVGCGDGTYAIAAAKCGARVTALDVSDEMLDAARRRAAEHRAEIRILRADATELPFEDGAFDRVVAMMALCFIEDPTPALREMSRVLALGGRLVVGELNRWSLWAASRRVRGWLGSRSWRSATFRSERDLRRLMREVGLEVERVAGAVYYPPLGAAANLLAPLDALPRAITTVGAAFVAAAAIKPPPPTPRGDTP